MDSTHGLNLLAVDLGLRTGIALYGPDGRLVSYRSKHFGSVRVLRRGIATILRESPPLGWIWIEGGGVIAEAWVRLAELHEIELHQIQAPDWRVGLMLPRQQRNAMVAKREAGALARKVIEWSEAPRPKGSLRHDAAEAILIGLHGARSVGLLGALPRL